MQHMQERCSIEQSGKQKPRTEQHSSARGCNLVEAAGIEPASRDISMQASTCVVDCLIFDPLTRADAV